MWTAIAFVVILSAFVAILTNLSRKISRFRRIRRVLRRRNRRYKIKEAAAIVVFLLFFVSLNFLVYLDNAERELVFPPLLSSIDDTTEPPRGVVRAVSASETSKDMKPIKPSNGEGAMSCPVGRGLVLLRRVINPVDPTQVPRIIAGALETASGSLLECHDDEKNITFCDGYRNYKFDFYTFVALREIGVSEELVQCEPYDHFAATQIFRSYIVFQENGSTRGWRP